VRALVVLAGGRGERLGGLVKPLLVRPDGRTLIDHLLAALSPLADETLIVAPRAIASLVSASILDPGEGPGVALSLAARATACDQILLCAGDQVSPDRALAERLLDAGKSAAVRLGGILQPAFAVYETARVRAIDPPPRSLRGILAAIDPVVIEEEPSMAAAFEDADTEDDVARHRLSKRGVPT